jgi:O-Antigen ligase
LSNQVSVAFGLTALSCGAAAAALSMSHPVAPWWSLGLACIAALGEARRPGLWMFLLPACLPWLNFSPWTGWMVFEEFDILLLSLCAGAYTRMAMGASDVSSKVVGAPDSAFGAVVPSLPWSFLAWSAIGLLAFLLGWKDAGGGLDLFSSHVDAGNSFRVAKSLLWVWLCTPLAWEACREHLDSHWRSFASGTCLGLWVVSLVVVWERAVYPGLLDFETVYRASGPFWEMHVGGSPIDVYLALGLPFAVMVSLRAPGHLSRWAALALVLMLIHALVATASRLALIGGLVATLVWVLLQFRRRSPAMVSRKSRPVWPWVVAAGVCGTLAGLAMLVAAQDSFLANRLRATEHVWQQRLGHWSNGLQLARTGSERWLGIGLGRFVARYRADVPGGGLSGAVRISDHVPNDGVDPLHYLMIRGPDDSSDKSGLFALTQRVQATPGVRFLIGGSYRASRNSRVRLAVCERHLLYNWNCQATVLDLADSDGGWHAFSLPMEGDRFEARQWRAPTLGMFSISTLTPGAQVDLAGLVLHDGVVGQRLINGDFAVGMARWFPAAQYYFQPWHADAAWLEILVERGILGLLAAVAVLASIVIHLKRLRQKHRELGDVLAGGLAGVLVVGLGASVLDVARVAFLVQFLLLFAVLASRDRIDRDPGSLQTA